MLLDSGPSSIQTTSQTPAPSPDVLETPLFEPDAFSEIAEDQLIEEQGFPSPSLASFVEDESSAEPPPSPLLLSACQTDIQESQAMEEMRQHFGWLTKLFESNSGKVWGSGYKDFVDASLLLHAVRELGMVERGNGRVSDGVFSASTGNYALTLRTFIGAMPFEHAPTTWANKLTMYFRLKSLYSYSQHAGDACFQSPTHRAAWQIVRFWVRDQDQLLPERSWVTTKYGNTELRILVREMVQEANKSKFYLLINFFCTVVLILKPFYEVGWSIL